MLLSDKRLKCQDKKDYMRDPVSTALANMIIFAHLFACGDPIIMRVTSPMASHQVPKLNLVFFFWNFCL